MVVGWPRLQGSSPGKKMGSSSRDLGNCSSIFWRLHHTTAISRHPDCPSGNIQYSPTSLCLYLVAKTALWLPRCCSRASRRHRPGDVGNLPLLTLKRRLWATRRCTYHERAQLRNTLPCSPAHGHLKAGPCPLELRVIHSSKRQSRFRTIRAGPAKRRTSGARQATQDPSRRKRARRQCTTTGQKGVGTSEA